MFVKLVYAALCILAVATTGESIKCHKCSSHNNAQCADLSPNDTSTLVECPRAEHILCRKTVQKMTDSDETRVTRDCGFIKFEKYDGDYCMNSNTNFKKERSCQCFKDGCNGGNGVRAMKALVFVVFPFIYLRG